MPILVSREFNSRLVKKQVAWAIRSRWLRQIALEPVFLVYTLSEFTPLFAPTDAPAHQEPKSNKKARPCPLHPASPFPKRIPLHKNNSKHIMGLILYCLSTSLSKVHYIPDFGLSRSILGPQTLLTFIFTGTVFDVSSRPDRYGPNGGHHIFAGRDASRGLGMSSTKPEDADPDWSTLNGVERKVLNDRYEFSSKRYPVVGKVSDLPESVVNL